MSGSLRCLSRDLLRDRHGSVALWVAFSAPLLFGIAAFAVDASQLYALKTRLQGAADAAAVAAVGRLPDEEAAENEARSYAAKNLPPEEHGEVLSIDDVELGWWDDEDRIFAAGGSPLNAAKVSVQRSSANDNPAGTHFAHLFGIDQVDVVAEAVAVSARVCAWSLNPAAPEAVRIESGADVVMEGCGLQVNSSDEKAMKVESGGCLDATSVNIAGDYSGSCVSSTPQTGTAQFDDPLADLEEPSYGPCTYPNELVLADEGTYVLVPGVYCGGIKVGENATVTFLPGLYVLGGTGLHLEEGASASGTDVTFFMTHGDGDWGSVLLEDDSSLDVSAPSTGELAHIAFFFDRDMPPGDRFLIEDVSLAKIEGAIYAPTIHFWLETNGSIDLTGLLIADTMTFETNADVRMVGDPAMPAGNRTRLVY